MAHSRTSIEMESLQADRITAGGARRDRTDDLLLAKQALSQLSYGPAPSDGWLANRSLRIAAQASPLRATPGNLLLHSQAKVGGPGKI